MKRTLFFIILLITLPIAARATDSVDIEIPDDMYRSAVAIGYQNALGQNMPYGTGVLIKSGRHFVVVTARHVILDKNLNLRSDLIFWGNTKQGKEFSRSFEENRAKWPRIHWVIHKSADIAAIIIGIKEAEDDVYFVSLSDFLDVKDLKKGQSVYYLGFPNSLGSDTGIDPVLRHGIISLKNSPDYFYIDATAAGGNSGGPVFRIIDSKAHFIGIVTDFPPSLASKPDFYYHTGVSRVYYPFGQGGRCF